MSSTCFDCIPAAYSCVFESSSTVCKFVCSLAVGLAGAALLAAGIGLMILSAPIAFTASGVAEMIIFGSGLLIVGICGLIVSIVEGIKKIWANSKNGLASAVALFRQT
jgi:hypothetical protein